MFRDGLLLMTNAAHDKGAADAIVVLAPRMGLKHLTVLQVVASDPILGVLAGEPGKPTPQEEVATVVAEIAQSLPGVHVEGLVAQGHFAEAAARVAEEKSVDIIVYGRPKDADEPGFDSAVNLVRFATCSALVVPQGARVDPHCRAVVGLDFSHNSIAAVVAGTTLFDTSRVVVQYDDSHGAHYEVYRKNMQEHWDRDIAPKLPSGKPSPDLDLVSSRKASDALIAAAGHDPLVVGSRGLSRFAAMLLGSTAERLARRSLGPLLVIREKGIQLGVVEGLFHR